MKVSMQFKNKITVNGKNLLMKEQCLHSSLSKKVLSLVVDAEQMKVLATPVTLQNPHLELPAVQTPFTKYSGFGVNTSIMMKIYLEVDNSHSFMSRKPGQVQTRDKGGWTGPNPTSLEYGLASWLPAESERVDDDGLNHLQHLCPQFEKTINNIDDNYIFKYVEDCIRICTVVPVKLNFISFNPMSLQESVV
uniref:Uncharacterized protein n=1 Tax=Timema douglasi TaxID=61478 RepID=A0A7R8VEL0_TIMDO|nr:unnamed protein product [Timema douglasi]